VMDLPTITQQEATLLLSPCIQSLLGLKDREGEGEGTFCFVSSKEIPFKMVSFFQFLLDVPSALGCW
jgi:hypothetical protein